MFSIPDPTEHVTKLADWIELEVLSAPDGCVGFGTLVSAADLEIEEQEADIADEDLRQEGLVVAVQAEIAARRKVIGDDYPFILDDSGATLQLATQITAVGAIYLFCLFLSHAFDRTIVPEDLAPDITNDVRDMFQVCATVAAAGYVEGIAISFGWPRPDDAAFLVAVQRVYGLFGDGTPVNTPPPAAPDQVKDDGIDIIAWRPSPDGLPGTHYLIGQVASGNDWRGKSVINYCGMFHKYWFSRQPAAPHQPAMFIPFCLDPKASDDPSIAQEIAVDYNMQRLTNQFGVIFYRYRLPYFAAVGLRVHAQAGHLIERVDELPRVEQWVQTYTTRLRAANT